MDVKHASARSEIQPQTAAVSRRAFIASSTALGISGIGVKDALAQTPKRGGHLMLGINHASSTQTLEPMAASSSYMKTIMSQLHDRLTVIDPQSVLQPSLAESWETKSGATDWVLKLRRGVTFHNGKEMTAEDVVYSLNQHRGETKSSVRALFAPITELTASDKYEIRIKLNGGNVDMPYVLATDLLVIVPKDSDMKSGLGAGPFKLDSFEPGVRTRTSRNRNDWRSDRGYVDSIETLAINDATARLSALISGSLHIINETPTTSVETLQAMPNMQVFNQPGYGHTSFPMLCDTPPYNDVNVRLALKYAIDRQAILKTVLRGHGTIGNDFPIPPSDPFYPSDIPQRQYDPDKAKFYFNKSSYSGDIVLTMADGVVLGASEVAQIFQGSAARAGIPFKINRVPADGYGDKIWRKVPFCMLGWGGRVVPDMMLSTAYTSDAPWNDTNWFRPQFDKLRTAARTEIDIAKRRQMYAEMLRMLNEDGGAIIPVFQNHIEAGSKRVRNYEMKSFQAMGAYEAPTKVWLADA